MNGLMTMFMSYVDKFIEQQKEMKKEEADIDIKFYHAMENYNMFNY